MFALKVFALSLLTLSNGLKIDLVTNKLLRVNAWIRRFISNLKLKRLRKSLNLDANLSVTELHSSETHLHSLA